MSVDVRTCPGFAQMLVAPHVTYAKYLQARDPVSLLSLSLLLVLYTYYTTLYCFIVILLLLLLLLCLD